MKVDLYDGLDKAEADFSDDDSIAVSACSSDMSEMEHIQDLK